MPVYNEEENIGLAIEKTMAEAAKFKNFELGYILEIFLVVL